MIYKNNNPGTETVPSLVNYLNKTKSPTWEADSHSASQEIRCLLQNPNFQYHIHICLPVGPVLSEMDCVHILTPYFSSDLF